MSVQYGVRYAPEAPTPDGDEPAANPQPVADLETARNFLAMHPTAVEVVQRHVSYGDWQPTT